MKKKETKKETQSKVNIEMNKKPIKVPSVAPVIEIIETSTDVLDKFKKIENSIKEKEDLFIENYFIGKIIPTKIYIYDRDGSHKEFDIEKIDIFTTDTKRPIFNTINENSILKLENYLNGVELKKSDVKLYFKQGPILLKYSIDDLYNNKWVEFEKPKKTKKTKIN